VTPSVASPGSRPASTTWRVGVAAPPTRGSSRPSRAGHELRAAPTTSRSSSSGRSCSSGNAAGSTARLRPAARVGRPPGAGRRPQSDGRPTAPAHRPITVRDVFTSHRTRHGLRGGRAASVARGDDAGWAPAAAVPSIRYSVARPRAAARRDRSMLNDLDPALDRACGRGPSVPRTRNDYWVPLDRLAAPSAVQHPRTVDHVRGRAHQPLSRERRVRVIPPLALPTSGWDERGPRAKPRRQRAGDSGCARSPLIGWLADTGL
jgi:hypothetical protein